MATIADLTGETISSSYGTLLMVTDTAGITSSLQAVQDGLGAGSSPLKLSTTVVVVDGDLGIGTDSPTSSTNYGTLSINGTSGSQIAFWAGGAAKQFIYNTAADLRIENHSTGNIDLKTTTGGSTTSRLKILSTGEVGINCTPSTARLHVKKDQNSDTVAQVTNDTAGTAATAQLRVESNSALGVISVQDDGYTSSGVYQADALSVFSASTASGGLVLGTEGDHNVSFYQNNAVKMTLDGTGLGIGTDAPTAKTEIVQRAATRGFQVIRNEDQANTEALAYFTDEHPSSTQATVRIRNDGTGDALQVMDGSSSALIVDGDGNVGIGAAPTAGILHTIGDGNQAVRVECTDDNHSRLELDADRSTEGYVIGSFDGLWNGTRVGAMQVPAGADTTNKDDGVIRFSTTLGGVESEAMRIDSSGVATFKDSILTANNKQIGWRNAADTANHDWLLNGSDALQYRSGGTPLFSITNAGHVGIGGDPSNLLGLSSAAATASQLSNAFPAVNIINTTASYAAGDIIGGVSFGKAAGHSAGFRAGMLALYSDSSTSNNVGTVLSFRTAAQDAGDSTERMLIDSAGAITGAGLKLDGGVIGHGSSDASSITICGGTSSGTTGANITVGGSSGSADRSVIFKVNATETMRIDASGNLAISNTTSVPSTPSSGGVLYVESGALKYIGSSGTVTTLGAA